MSRICADFCAEFFNWVNKSYLIVIWGRMAFVEMFKKIMKSCEFCLLIGRDL